MTPASQSGGDKVPYYLMSQELLKYRAQHINGLQALILIVRQCIQSQMQHTKPALP
jgi:hypothetical protein